MSVSGAAGRGPVDLRRRPTRQPNVQARKGEVAMEIRALWQPWRRHEPATEDRGQGREDSVPDELQARRAEIARMEERALRETESLKTQHADVERRLQV